MTKKILAVLAIVMLAVGAAVTTLSLTKERHVDWKNNRVYCLTSQDSPEIITYELCNVLE